MKNAEVRGASLHDDGFRLEGNCSEILSARASQCDQATVASLDGGSPWLAEAAALGVTTYVCETVASSDPSVDRTAYPIAQILRR